MISATATRNISEIENTMLVLYAVKVLAPVTLEALWPFVASHTQMDYFTLCTSVDTLQKDNALTQGNGALSQSLMLTQHGEKLLQLFMEKIPHSQRTTIEKNAASYLSVFREKQQLRVIRELAPEGFLGGAILLQENDIPTLHCHVQTTQLHQMQTFLQTGKERVVPLLTYLYTLPLAPCASHAFVQVETKEEAMALVQSQKEDIVLVKQSVNDYSVVFRLHNNNVVFTLLVWISNYENAVSFAQYIQQNNQAMQTELEKLLWGK